MRDGVVISQTKTPPVTFTEIKRKKKFGRLPDLGLLLLRLAVGGLMIFHGIGKISGGVEMIKPGVTELGLPDFLVYGLYIAEVVAPVMIIFGVWSRLAALTIVIDMIMAVLIVHKNEIFVVRQGGAWAIELVAFYFLASLALFFTGAGRYRVTRSGSKWD